MRLDSIATPSGGGDGARRVPDVLLVMRHRPDLFGREFRRYTHTLLHGDSEWSIGERELFASFTSKRLHCLF